MINKKRIQNALLILLMVCIALFVFTFFHTDDKNPNNDFYKKYTVYSLDIPDTLYFAGEKVPVEFSDVREALDRELLVNTYWQSHTILLIKRAHKYFPRIEPVLEKYNIPDDFKYLAVAESDLTNVISPSNAVGVWQFLKETAKEYNLEVTDEVDERYHLEKSTEAACTYLVESYNKYSNWTLVAASYNMGRKGLDDQIAKQKQNNYYDLLLNDETARYIYRILALKCIITNPQQYGFYIDDADLYSSISYDEVLIDSTINDLASFAINQGSNYKILKELNPWLRNNSLTIDSGRIYIIRLPEKDARKHKPIETSSDLEKEK